MTSPSKCVPPRNEWTEYSSLRSRIEEIKQVMLKAEVQRPKMRRPLDVGRVFLWESSDPWDQFAEGMADDAWGDE